MNKNQEIIKYEPLHKIITYSKKEYYIKSKDLPTFETFLEKVKFIKIGDSRVNVNSIDTIDPASKEEITIESILKLEKQSIREEAKKEIYIYKEKNPRAEITPNKIKKILEKIKNKNGLLPK